MSCLPSSIPRRAVYMYPRHPPLARGIRCSVRPSSCGSCRRIVRDHQFRGATAEYSLQLWDNVLSSEKIYIEPHRAQAHGVVDTTLGYELQTLQPYIVPLLRSCPKAFPAMMRCKRLCGDFLILRRWIPGWFRRIRF